MCSKVAVTQVGNSIRLLIFLFKKECWIAKASAEEGYEIELSALLESALNHFIRWGVTK